MTMLSPLECFDDEQLRHLLEAVNNGNATILPVDPKLADTPQDALIREGRRSPLLRRRLDAILGSVLEGYVEYRANRTAAPLLEIVEALRLKGVRDAVMRLADARLNAKPPPVDLLAALRAVAALQTSRRLELRWWKTLYERPELAAVAWQGLSLCDKSAAIRALPLLFQATGQAQSQVDVPFLVRSRLYDTDVTDQAWVIAAVGLRKKDRELVSKAAAEVGLHLSFPEGQAVPVSHAPLPVPAGFSTDDPVPVSWP